MGQWSNLPIEEFIHTNDKQQGVRFFMLKGEQWPQMFFQVQIELVLRYDFCS